MFRKTELEHLRLQKELLVLQSDANRLLLAHDWERLRAPATWMNEAGQLARRHPLWTTGLTAAAGLLMAKAARNRGAITGGLGRIGRLAFTAFSVWKMFNNKKSESPGA